MPKAKVGDGGQRGELDDLLLLLDVRTVSQNSRAADTQGEEGLAEGVEEGVSGDLGEIGLEEEFQTGSGPGQGHRADGDDNDGQEEQRHHDLGIALDAVLDAGQQHQGCQSQEDIGVEYRPPGSGYGRGEEALRRALLGQGERHGMHEVVYRPASHHAVEGYQSHGGQHAEHADQSPVSLG